MASYSFLDVVAAIAGPGGGFNLGAGSQNDEEGISAKFKGEKNVQKSGADGAIMNSLRASQAGVITLRYLKISPTNSMLMAMLNFQRFSGATWGQNFITVSNIASGDVYACQQMAFTKFPDVNWKTEGDVIEWEFEGLIDPFLGIGSPSLG